MKINIIVAGRFHVEQLSKILIDNNHDIRIYSSSPKHLFQKNIQQYVFFFPMPFQIFRKIFKIQIPDFLRNLDLFLFDFLVSMFMRKPDVVYGFASTSLACGKRYKDSYYILDRACPHINFQNHILEIESRKLGLPYKNENQFNTNRAICEYQIADKIFVPSIYSSNSFQADSSLRDKVYVTHLGCNEKFEVSKRISHDFTIGFLGENPLRKGLIYLLRASQKKSLENCNFLLRTNLDQFKDHQETQEIINRPNISVIKFIKDIKDFYNSCDVICLPSIDEGWGMVTLEALAQGKPIIVSTNVGSSSLIKNGFNGFVIEPYDSAAIEDNIYRLFKDPQLLDAMQNNAINSYNNFMNSDDSYENKISNFFKNLSLKNLGNIND